MALDATKNQLFHQKCKNIVQALIALHAEVEKQAEYFTSQVQGSPAFVDTPIATVAEMTAMFGVMGHFRTFMNEGTVPADALRRDKLMPFLSE